LDESINEMHKKIKERIRETLSKENLEDYEARATETVEEHLHPLLDNQIGNCYAAAITKRTSQFIICCEEIERLNKENAFFQQLKKKATRVQTSVNELQLH
jgi:hypothetical protein